MNKIKSKNQPAFDKAYICMHFTLHKMNTKGIKHVQQGE